MVFRRVGCSIEWRGRCSFRPPAVFAVEKPGHLDGINTLSFQFYVQAGAAAFKVFLHFGEAISTERTGAFATLRDRFRKVGA
jgi:hypothetical protein